MEGEIRGLDWMGPGTKARALEKLHASNRDAMQRALEGSLKTVELKVRVVNQPPAGPTPLPPHNPNAVLPAKVVHE